MVSLHPSDEEIYQIEVKLFLEAIYQRFGHDFREYSKAAVSRRVRSLMRKAKCTHPSELIPPLLHNEAFAQTAILEFSIPVTEMFRDPLFYESLLKNVFPYLSTYPFLKIWHAGCSTGEEVYSLAILLQEAGLYQRSTIFATDFNEVSLEKAREGIYPLREIHKYIPNYIRSGGKCALSDYYHAQYELGIMDRSLKRNITFASHNLVTDSTFGEMNLVFCRNVMIYFGQALRQRVLLLLSNSIERGGFLCLGNKESLSFTQAAEYFRAVDDAQRIYQKRLQ